MTNIKQLLEKLTVDLDRAKSKLEIKTFTIYPTLLGSVFFFIFSLTVLFIIPREIRTRVTTQINPQTFPRMLVFIILICSSLLVLKEIALLIMKRPVDQIKINVFTEVKFIVLLVLLIFFAFLIQIIGFILSSLIYSFLMLLFFRIKKKHYYLIVLGSAVAIGVLFRYLLNVRLP